MNYRITQYVSILFMGIVLASCNYVDDYMLGKDNTLMPHTLKPFTPKWHFKKVWVNSISGKQSAGHLQLAPVSANHMIYTATSDGVIAATEAKTGSVRWRKQFPAGFISGPAMKDNLLALGTANDGLQVLNGTDGNEIWHQDLSSELMAPPLLVDHKAIAKTMDGTVIAYSLNQGKKLWAVEHGSPQLILKASSGLVKMNDWVLAAFSDGKVDALEADSGRVVWEHEMAYAIGASDVERLVDIDADLVVSGNVFYVASFQGELGAFSLNQGDFIWCKPISTFHNMASNSQSLFVVDNDSVLWAIDKSTGQILWKQAAFKARGLTSPTLMGNRLLVADKQGYLHGLSARTGEVEARMELGYAIEAAPLVDGSRVYVMTLKGELISLSVQ